MTDVLSMLVLVAVVVMVVMLVLSPLWESWGSTPSTPDEAGIDRNPHPDEIRRRREAGDFRSDFLD